MADLQVAQHTESGLDPSLATSESPSLLSNMSLFNDQERELLLMLLAEGQGHLFASWPGPGEGDEHKLRLVSQLMVLDKNYHGGLKAYIHTARKLLQDAREGVNPLSGYVPAVPEGEKVDFASSHFLKLEAEGLRAVSRAAFVLVAGGLGERLGYSGIKLALPTEMATGRCFLELYIKYILALQARSQAPAPLPLAIMTSDDTHEWTLRLLEDHQYFGMERDQVTLIKQEKVACLTDIDAHLALMPSDPYCVETKPHGHGDVHALLHQSGLARQWHQQGYKWVCFFQDTNSLVFRALLVALGVSSVNDYDMNSLAVPRKAKEAIGAISLLRNRDGHQLTINVEYNQLDPLLRATINPEGDVNDETGFSPFPGNINQLVLKLSSYVESLAQSGGIIAEFINPKYKDASRTSFKSSTRLECMMQDYPWCLPSSARVGFTLINQIWATYSPVKNSVADARAKAKEGNPTHSATTGEMDIYKSNSMLLREVAGAMVGPPAKVAFNDIPVEEWPHVVLAPSFAPTLADVAAKVSQGGITMSSRSSLVLEGADVHIDKLQLDGALVVKAVPGARVQIKYLEVSNSGWQWVPLEQWDESQGVAKEEDRIRGFKVLRREAKELVFSCPGDYEVDIRQGP